MNTLREAEILATMIIFCALWLIIPWEPLTPINALWAVLAVVALAGGLVALVEHVIREVIGR